MASSSALAAAVVPAVRRGIGTGLVWLGDDGLLNMVDIGRYMCGGTIGEGRAISALDGAAVVRTCASVRRRFRSSAVALCRLIARPQAATLG